MMNPNDWSRIFNQMVEKSLLLLFFGERLLAVA